MGIYFAKEREGVNIISAMQKECAPFHCVVTDEFKMISEALSLIFKQNPMTMTAST